MEEAQFLTKYAAQVYIIHRREEFRASAAMQQKVLELEKAGKIQILWNTEVVKINGTEKVNSLSLKNNKDNTTSELPVDGVFIAIGHVPTSSLFTGKVELDERGFVKRVPNEKYQMTTSVRGVFVAGEVHDYEYKQAITTAAYGCMAAMEALKLLDKESRTW